MNPLCVFQDWFSVLCVQSAGTLDVQRDCGQVSHTAGHFTQSTDHSDQVTIDGLTNLSLSLLLFIHSLTDLSLPHLFTHSLTGVGIFERGSYISNQLLVRIEFSKLQVNLVTDFPYVLYGIMFF